MGPKGPREARRTGSQASGSVGARGGSFAMPMGTFVSSMAEANTVTEQVQAPRTWATPRTGRHRAAGRRAIRDAEAAMVAREKVSQERRGSGCSLASTFCQATDTALHRHPALAPGSRNQRS